MKERIKPNVVILDKLNSISDIVDVMVRGLEREWVRVNMGTFGSIGEKTYLFGLVKKDVCVGCAATNFLCELMQKPFSIKNIEDPDTRADQFSDVLPRDTVVNFESAIDALRTGSISCFLDRVRCLQPVLNFKIPFSLPDFFLPVLRTETWKENLSIYADYADYLRSKNL